MTKRLLPVPVLSLFLATTILPIISVQANEPMITGVMASQTGKDTWRFDVTVSHEDKGWEHYADRWDILAPDGTVLASRVLAHPHDDEQPFTRSLDGVVIPQNITTITLRAHDKVHGDGSGVTLDLQKAMDYKKAKSK